MYNNTEIIRLKECNRCKWKLPANNVYFNNDNKSKDGLNTLCKQCRLEYRILTKDEKRAYDEIYRIKHIEERESYFAKWKKENRDKYLEGKKKYNQENAEKRKIWHAKWIENNRERHRKSANLSCQRRLARKRSLPANLTSEQWKKIQEDFNYHCAYCGNKTDKLQKEHFVPLSKGGEFTKDNIIPSCMKCNRNKSDKSFFEWYPNYKHYSKQREQKIISYLGYKNKMQQLSIL